MAILAGAGAMAAIAAGCGSDETTALTKAEFIKQADAICKEGNSRARNEFEAFAETVDGDEPGKDPTKEVGEEVLLPNLEVRAEKLQALEPPSGDEDEVAAWLDAVDKGIDEGREDPATLLGSEFSKDYPLDEANGMAGDYGLKICSQG